SGANFASFTIDTFSSTNPLALLGPETPGSTGGTGDTGPNGQQIVPMSLTNALSSGSVIEGGLSEAVDQFGPGNTPGAPTVAAGVAGSLDALVNFGTGGPGAVPFQFVSPTDANTWLGNLGLTSHGVLIDTATINGNTLVASTDTAGGTPHDVFS